MFKPLIYLIIPVILVSFFSCGDDEDDVVYSPKPRGYFRIDFPEKNYRSFDSLSECSFEIPTYAYVQIEKNQAKSVDTGRYANARPHWMNIKYPKFKATVNMTHLWVHDNLNNYLEDSHFFAFSKHQIKATGIDQSVVLRDSAKVYGLVFDIEGNTASSVQFYLTDSTKHFLRGALYFDARTNIDSLKLVIDFIRKDLIRMITTTKWKNEPNS
jgi:gliding motility-associated lipoprotein GldD